MELKYDPYYEFDTKAPTAFLLGRYQPFHDGHLALVKEAICRVGQVTIAVRDTHSTDEKNPFHYGEVYAFIVAKLQEEEIRLRVSLLNRVRVFLLPNITNIFYGRDVGYAIEKIELSPELQAVSATKVREEMGISKAQSRKLLEEMNLPKGV